MLLQQQTTAYLTPQKQSILAQIPRDYSPHNSSLTICLKVDLAKMLMRNKPLALHLISNLPTFQFTCKASIAQFMQERGCQYPEFGVHLGLRVVNCPLPVGNLGEWRLMGYEQREGLMVYLKELVVVEVGQGEMYLGAATEIWGARCACKDAKAIYKKNICKSLLKTIQQNAQNQNKLKNTQQQPHSCAQCQRNYSFLGRQNQLFLNCQRVRFLLPPRYEKQSIFESREFVAYGELGLCAGGQGRVQAGSVVSVCAYVFCRPIVNKMSVGAVLGVKGEYSAFLVNVQVESQSQSSLALRPENNEFFYQLSKLGLTQKYCKGLSDSKTLLQNYQSLVQSIDRFKFAYLPPSMLTTLKLSLLNSICSHPSAFSTSSVPTLTPTSSSTPLHICITTQDIQLALRVMYIAGLDIKRWPSQYDNTTLINWLKCCRGSIVIVVCPGKKDLQLLEQYFMGKLAGLERVGVTFWVLWEAGRGGIKKEMSVQYFGIVLDLTTEKNIHVCKQALQQCIDMKLSAFVTEQFEEITVTIAKPKNARARIQLIQNPTAMPSQAQIQLQQQASKRIIQNYYLKCRSLRKTTPTTLPYLYQLSQNFCQLRHILSTPSRPQSPPNPHHRQPISILDTVLAIFLDQQTTRHKYSGMETIFGGEISKLMLNERDVEISFWDFMSQDDGTMLEWKNYMGKGEMFGRVVGKLEELLDEQDEGDGGVLGDWRRADY